MTNYNLRTHDDSDLAPTVLIGFAAKYLFQQCTAITTYSVNMEDAGASIIEPLAVSSRYGYELTKPESIGQLSASCTANLL